MHAWICIKTVAYGLIKFFEAIKMICRLCVVYIVYSRILMGEVEVARLECFH